MDNNIFKLIKTKNGLQKLPIDKETIKDNYEQIYMPLSTHLRIIPRKNKKTKKSP